MKLNPPIFLQENEFENGGQNSNPKQQQTDMATNMYTIFLHTNL